jgi:hypothetical protein
MKHQVCSPAGRDEIPPLHLTAKAIAFGPAGRDEIPPLHLTLTAKAIVFGPAGLTAGAGRARVGAASHAAQTTPRARPHT